MSLSDRILSITNDSLDESSKESLVDSIKKSIAIILNSKTDFNETLFDNINHSLKKSDFCYHLGEKIHSLIKKYEKRIEVKSINFDNSFFKNIFFLNCLILDSDFGSFDIKIIVYCDQTCEIL